jgi:hypothetical protein
VASGIISSTPKMEAICSSETSVATQQTTRRHIPEDDISGNLARAGYASETVEYGKTLVLRRSEHRSFGRLARMLVTVLIEISRPHGK